MAKYYYSSKLSLDSDKTKYDVEYKTSQTIEYSGIYKCKTCGYEIALNAHEGKVPPHQEKNYCTNQVFKLIVKTD